MTVYLMYPPPSTSICPVRVGPFSMRRCLATVDPPFGLGCHQVDVGGYWLLRGHRFIACVAKNQVYDRQWLE